MGECATSRLSEAYDDLYCAKRLSNVTGRSRTPDVLRADFAYGALACKICKQRQLVMMGRRKMSRTRKKKCLFSLVEKNIGMLAEQKPKGRCTGFLCPNSYEGWYRHASRCTPELPVKIVCPALLLLTTAKGLPSRIALGANAPRIGMETVHPHP